jgi:thioredoxin reductase (NADPH)
VSAAETDFAEPPQRPDDDQRFPRLSPAQIERLLPHGSRRTVLRGEVLCDVGDPCARLYLVLSGELEVLRRSPVGDQLITVHHAGQFSGEVSTLAGRRSLVQLRVRQAGEVVEVVRSQLLSLVQGDSDLSDVFMRAFVLRRASLIAAGTSDAVVLGATHCSVTVRIKAFLARNGHPYTFIDLERDEDVQALLDRFGVSVADVPVLICRGDVVLRRPSNEQIAECLGFNDAIADADIRDVVIIGAGPSGLAAAVYAASEGLETLVLEANAPGGQAGSSSKIENYLGFPTGISGEELAARAYTQAQKFGAEIMIARRAQRLVTTRRPYQLDVDGHTLVSRTVIIATGVSYRRLALPNLARFENAGVYYTASYVESQLCRDEDVIVVGGGNSAGQAAVFLAQTARRVHMLVRAGGLSETMSRYLIHRIEQSPAIELHTRTEIVALEGAGNLERVSWRDGAGRIEDRPVRHVFSMTGAVPCTSWLADSVVLDAHGFVKTGAELTADDLIGAGWPLARPPHLLETSVPGVFAIGDVRSGNVKRVAPAVGEGSVAVSLVHGVLRE